MRAAPSRAALQDAPDLADVVLAVAAAAGGCIDRQRLHRAVAVYAYINGLEAVYDYYRDPLSCRCMSDELDVVIYELVYSGYLEKRGRKLCLTNKVQPDPQLHREARLAYRVAPRFNPDLLCPPCPRNTRMERSDSKLMLQ